MNKSQKKLRIKVKVRILSNYLQKKKTLNLLNLDKARFCNTLLPFKRTPNKIELLIISNTLNSVPIRSRLNKSPERTVNHATINITIIN